MDSSQQLCRKRLSYNTLGDHIEEIRFAQPVSISAFWVGNACTGGPGQAVLRAYAKDIQGPSGSRFVPLCSSTVTCPEDGFTSVQTEAITTDCIIVRGRYKQVDILFHGKHLTIPNESDTQTTCQDAAALEPFKSHKESQKVDLLPLCVEDPCLPFADGFSGPVAYALASIVGFDQAAGTGRVSEMDPPAGAVQEMFSVADNLCKVLSGAEGKQYSSDDVERMASSGIDSLGVSEELYIDSVVLSIKWIKRLCWLGGTGLALDVKKGMIGLAMALVLSSCRKSVVHFLANGGVEALAEAFQIRRVTARMVRYLTSTCEMITLTASSMGCEALLGWWAPPEKHKVPHSHAPGERVLNHEERDVIHVPGILQVKVRVKKEDPDLVQKSAGVSGKDGQGTEPQHRSLPPGMVITKPQDLKGTRSQGLRVSPVPSGPPRQNLHEEFSDNIWPRKSADRNRHKGKRKLVIEEDYEDHVDPTFITSGRHLEHQTSPRTEKDQDNQVNKGSDYKSRHSANDKKDSQRDTEKRKERKKHKSHHKNKEAQSPNEQERIRDGDRHDSQWQEHEKAREPEEGHSKHKKRRHDERRKERRKSREDSQRRDAQEDTKVGVRDGGGEGAPEKTKDKERKRQRRKGKNRGKDREKDHDGRQDGTSTKSSKRQDASIDLRNQRENGSVNVPKDSNKPDTLPPVEKDRGLKRQRSPSCDHPGDETKVTHANTNTSKTIDCGVLAGPLVLPLAGVDLYDILVNLLMQPRAEHTVLCTSRTILRLNAYKATVDFEVAVNLAREKVEGGPSEDIVSHLQQASNALRQLSMAIQKLSNVSQKKTTAGVRDDCSKGLRASFGLDLDACVRSCLSSHNFLANIVVMLMIPTSVPSPSGVLYTRMRQAINEGFRSIIVQLTSSPSGLSLLRHHMYDVVDMVSGLGQHWNDEDDQKMVTMDYVDVVEEVVSLVGDIMRACEAVDIILSSRIINSVNGARAVSTLTEMLSRGATRQAAILPMGLIPNFFHHLLGMTESRLDFQKKLAKLRIQMVNPGVDTQEAISPEPFQWSVLPILDIMLQMSRAGGTGPVSRICEVAADMIQMIESEQKQSENEKGSELSVEALELLGRCKMCMIFNEKGCNGVMEKLGIVTPKPEGIENNGGDPVCVMFWSPCSDSLNWKNSCKLLQPCRSLMREHTLIQSGDDDKKNLPQEINPALIVQLIQSAEDSGMVMMGVDILASHFSTKAANSSTSVVYCASTLSTFTRVLQCAIDGVLAAQADGEWMFLGGDFRSEISVTQNKERAVMLMQRTANLLDGWSLSMQKNRVAINSTQLLTALIRAQSLLTTLPEGLRAMRGAATRNCSILKARHSIASVLRRWAEMEWGPDVILTVFKGESEVGNRVANNLEPKRMFCISCLLGDIFPTEWPPAKNLPDGLKSFPPPTNIKTRATLARSLEPCAKQFRHIVEFSLGCESQLMRCAAVRMCARAAGLGGGMGCFLAEPFIEEVVRLSRRETPMSTDHYHIVEYLLTLCMWPAMKAAFLDLKATSFISRLLHSVAPKCPDEPAAVPVADMIVKVLSWLCDPDICLNSLTTVSERLKTDHPSVAETSNLVAALLSNLVHLKGSSEAVLALLTRIRYSALGKASIISGLGKWHSAQMTASGSACNLAESSQASISWAVKQLEEQALSVEGGPSDETTQTCSAVADLLKSVEDFTEVPPPEEQGIPSAPNRFKSAVQAAVQFAASSDESDSSLGKISTELPNIHPFSLIFDASTQHYWRLCKIQESLKPMRKNMTRWACENTGNGAVTSLFAQGLAGASRPRQVQRGVYLSRPGEENVGHIHRDDPMLQMIRRVDDIPPVEVLPDLPPVFAPPRRGQEARRMRMGIGSSRPPSIHVDAFQKRDGPQLEQGGELSSGDLQDVGGVKQGMAKVSNPQGEASSDHNQEAPEPSGAVEEKVPIVSASTEAGGPKEGTALLSNPPKSKPFTISLPPRVRKEAPPPPPPPAAQTVVPQEPLPVQPGAQIEPDEQPKDSVQEPLQQENAEKMARDQPSHVPSLSQASRVSTDGDAPKKSASQSSDLPPKEGPSTSEVQKESLVPGIDFTEDPQEDEIDGPLGTSWGTESPQVPELSPENSETESGDGNVEVPPGVGTSGPPSPDISMLVRGQERGGITKDSVKNLLHDPSQMREILKQHPQLVAALQAKLNQNKGNPSPSQGARK